jgi:hypothetical protein
LSDIFIPNHIELCSIVAAHKDQENSGGGGGGGGGDGGDGGGKEEKGGKGGKGGVVGTIDGSDDEVVAALAWLTKECPNTLVCVKMGAEGAMLAKGKKF